MSVCESSQLETTQRHIPNPQIQFPFSMGRDRAREQKGTQTLGNRSKGLALSPKPLELQLATCCSPVRELRRALNLEKASAQPAKGFSSARPRSMGLPVL